MAKYDNAPECPECGEEMVKRRNGKTREAFWGCVYFPQCDGTVPVDEPVKRGNYPDWAKGQN